MSGVKRTRTDEISSSSQTTTSPPKIEGSSTLNTSVEEDYNW